MTPKGFKYLIYLMIQKFTMLKNARWVFIILLSLPLIVTAQKKQEGVDVITRCYTMERVQQYLLANPAAKDRASQVQLNVSATNKPTTFRPANVEGIINIPVIFHIVLPNPYIITDAVIQSQIDELNIDYAGLNADSTNAVAFYPVRGHSSKIRFVLAKRTPDGSVSNGIDRVESSTSSNVNFATDPIKRASLGGADVWDPASYLNIWVGNDVSGKRLLGYAQFPQSGNAADDGIFCNYTSLGVSSCNVGSYNKGRTLCHEIGHYLGLFHIWGDEDLCTGDDFRSLLNAGSSAVLPAGLFNVPGQENTIADIGDTPNQGASSTTCFSGIVTDNCAIAAPGKMYQNYMDYTADNCYSLFTKKQVERMEWILDNSRTSLKTSLGGTLPSSAVTLDVSPYQPVSPGGIDAIGCTTFTYPSVLSCPGTIIPKVRIRNNGTDKLTSITVGLLVNGVAQTPVNVTLPGSGLILGATKVISFPTIAATIGTYTLQFYTYKANGVPIDNVPSNDTLTTTLSISNGIALPASEGFEQLPFPANYWSLYNPNGDATWSRATVGNNSSNSMFIDNFSKNNIGLIDELRTPKFIVSPTDSLIITFDLAHKNYPGRNDKLSVLVSNDCGANWIPVFAKAGDALATAGSVTAGYTLPIASDWKNQQITIGGAILSTGKIIVAFRNTGDYGNNIFIDNINIYSQNDRDLFPISILSPINIECSPFISAPQLIIGNKGQKTITAYKIGYTLNNGAAVYKNFTQPIAPAATDTVTLDPLVTQTGSNTIKIFTADPVSISGSGDQNSTNDTISKTFTTNKTIDAPLFQGFESTLFAPLNWTIINPDAANTWVRKSPGSNSRYAAFIDNFSNNFRGQTDALQSPAINVLGADSVIISFDLAHKNFEGVNDRLQVKISTDCGTTFSTIFNKSGAELATAGSLQAAYINPAETDWKTQRIVLDSSSASNGTIIVSFENTSNYGNNIFIDNINISKQFKRDLKIISVNQPISASCSTQAILPMVTVSNAGIDTVNAFEIIYNIDGGPTDTTKVSGISLAAGERKAITLNTFNSTVGSHTFNVFCLQPPTGAGSGNLFALNDTLKVPFVIVGVRPVLPLTEGFETTDFPPANWGIVNVDGLTTWERSSTGARTGNGAMVIKNFSYGVSNTIDKFVSPLITNSSSNDSVFVAFDLAYKQGSTYPGATLLPLDTLEVQVTKDCGVTYQTVWKKWGENLQTVNDPNSPNLTSFVPTISDWKNISLYLSPFTGKDNFQLYLVAKSNQQNNIWIDNINIYAKTLPQKLKQQGYLIYPNPFSNTFLIHHYAIPVNLQALQLYNSAGQLVWNNWYTGNANTEITVDLHDNAKGVYILKMIYSNKTIVQKIIRL